jgi:AcrR family transcriptional regulator
MPRRIATSPRKKPRQERAQSTVDAIVEATAHILVHDGYDALSTNRVAERAGVSIGSLYQYFPNKEALVGELVDRVSGRLFQIVFENLQQRSDAPPEELVTVIVRALLHEKRQSPKLSKVLREQIPRTGRLARYEREVEKVVELGAGILAKHRSRLRVRDPHVASFVAVHMLDALIHATVTQPAPASDETMVRAITDAVTRYLLAEPTRETQRPPAGDPRAAS